MAFLLVSVWWDVKLVLGSCFRLSESCRWSDLSCESSLDRFQALISILGDIFVFRCGILHSSCEVCSSIDSNIQNSNLQLENDSRGNPKSATPDQIDTHLAGESDYIR